MSTVKLKRRHSLWNCYWQATVNKATQECSCFVWTLGNVTSDMDTCHGENLTCFFSFFENFTSHNQFKDNNGKNFKYAYKE